MNQVIERLRSAQRVTVLTGAGISAESGIPTFREAQTGLWQRFRPEDLATPEAFARNPETVWDWYRMRREMVDAAKPNAGHTAITELQRHVPHTAVVTQNVDGLHEAAGAVDVIELHGSLRRVRCTACGNVRNWERSDPVFPPTCTCGATMRPDVVWFGENLPERALERAFEAAEFCDVCLSVGTSNLVHPAASLPWLAAKHGALVAIINVSMEDQGSGPNVIHMKGKAGDILPRVVNGAFPKST